MKIKPKLVDYSLLKPKTPPKPKFKPKPKLLKKVEPSKSNDISFYINVFGILVLIIGGLCLYQRLVDRDKDELEKQNTILGFHHYVQQNVQQNVQEDAVSTK
tara:strand:+ start:286 stop:591 length:306 start_codon:yes stop_codon:yes gene_type:complete